MNFTVSYRQTCLFLIQPVSANETVLARPEIPGILTTGFSLYLYTIFALIKYNKISYTNHGIR